MKKRKILSFGNSQDINKQNMPNAGIDADKDLNVVSTKNKPNPKEKKSSNAIADISHKHTSGANNWLSFLKLNQQETKGFNKPNVVKSKQGHKLRKLPLDNPVDLSKEKGLKSVNRNTNNSMITDSNEKPMLYDNFKSNSKVIFGERQTKNSKPVLTKQIAMDCEMVGVEVGVNNSILARVSLVNAHGDCVYDKFVKPTEPILDYRTRVSGVRPKDLQNASDFKTVQQEVADIITGRVLVGHALKNDLKVLFLSHPRHAVRDTSKFKRFKVGKIPALKNLAKKYLGVVIQDGEHSSVQDALAAMQLYKMFKKEWEASIYKKKFTNQKVNTMTPSSAPTATAGD